MRKQKKSFIIFFVAMYFVMNVFGTMFFAGQAKAQMAVADPGIYFRMAAENAKKGFWEKLATAGMGALMNGISFLVKKVAYDTASYLAAGGKGQSPLAFDKGLTGYLEEVGGSVTGELIGSLGEPFGLNLCKFPDPKLNLNLKLGLANMFPKIGPSGVPEGPKPKCDWQQLKDNWSPSALDEKFGDGASAYGAEIFSGSLNIEQSGFGIAMDSKAQIDNARASFKAGAEAERILNQGWKDIVSPISGRIMTPASQIRKEAESLSAAEQQKLNVTQTAGIYGSNLKSLPYMAASIFLNTLGQKLLKQVMTGLLPDTAAPGQSGSSGSVGPAGGIASFFASTLQDNRKAAQKAFSFLTAPSINQIDNYDIVADLSSNRIIDSGMEQAINRGTKSGGVFLTIAEAIEQNLLHGSWQLIPPTHALNSSEANDCYIKAYCYSNIQKLRKARVLPIGFELAVLKSNPDKPWSLGEVVNGFDDCDENGQSSSANPYCHLINPNWIIKVPQTRCGTEGYGPNLVDKATPFRQTECMDLQTCISERADGSCLAWGYCTKEKNIWHLDGEECPNYYSTCTTYTDTASRASASYLARTVDFGQCAVESVGCKGYSTEKDAGDWLTFSDINNVASLKAAGRPGSIYFNRNVETCPSASEGCEIFYGAQRNVGTGLLNLKNGEYIRNTANLINLKKAPDYLGCYDKDLSTPTIIDWPQTETEVLNMNIPSECGRFSQVCAASEVGCSLYTSARSGDTVPAIIKQENGCPRECSGYETFKQRKSNFEDEKFPLYFIPALADVCSAQYEGCDEFTNVEEAYRGGEGLEYYSLIKYCEKPNVVAEKIFYSWEGSHSEGFVLRNHKLKSIDAAEAGYIAGLGLDYDFNDDLAEDGSEADFEAGSPAYSDNTQNAIQDNFNLCNRTSYALAIDSIFNVGAASPDCRQFYDNAGHEYYRMMRDTVIIADECRRLRKSEPRLFVDSMIVDNSTCTNQAKGVWGDSDGDGVSECNRCYGGGQIDGNTCIYNALPAESSSCPSIANSCRAYTGNTGNNVRQNIIGDDFEATTTTDDWALLDPLGDVLPTGSNISISDESLQTGQHSLRVSNSDGDGQEYLIRFIRLGTSNQSVSLQRNGWFELSFWARGTPQRLEIRIMQDRNEDNLFNYNMADPTVSETFGLFTHEVLNASNVSSISIGNQWREYTLGPVQFTGSSLEEAALSFGSVGEEGAYFIDNVRVNQIEDSAYLIKDSWKQTVEIGGVEVLADAPSTCFAPGENPVGLLPGFALGCSEYSDERTNTYYLTGFASLCREAAVGCEPLFETNNTITGEDARLPKLYNAICEGLTGECVIDFYGSIGRCFIPEGSSSCYVPELVLPLDDNGTPDNFDDDEYRDLSDFLDPSFNFGTIDLSTVYVSAESGTPIFMTNRDEYKCSATDVGCSLLGSQDQVLPSTSTLSYEYSDIYIKNNPETYSQILCSENLIGCNEYAAGADTYYFRDPVETGNSVCEYKENVKGFDGWYVQGVGTCASALGSYCRSDSDCEANDCTDIGSVPCYSNYLRDEVYSLWSNDSDNYAGFVGACSSKYNACTELLDPADTSSINPDGRAYYRIFDDDLTEKTGECNGQVSLKEGCVLFDRTDQPNKYYNAELTYEMSNLTDPKYEFVNPQVSAVSADNNTNLLLKVTRDRECSEWLSCSNKSIVRNEKGDKQVLCSKYKACAKLKESGRDDECQLFVQPVYNETFLDEDRYVERDLSWYGSEYSGYSLVKKHQILTYGYFSFPSMPTKQFLGAELPSPSYLPDNCSASLGDTNGNPCGSGLFGRCFGGRCVDAIDNSPFPAAIYDSNSTVEEIAAAKSEAVRLGLLPATCKIYSEEDSPFPYASIANEPADNNVARANSVIKTNDEVENKSRIEFTIFNEFFKDVNLCQGREDCSCDYNKYVYGNFTDYYSLPISTEGIIASAPEGVCVSGEKDGEPCENNNDCVVMDENNTVISSGECSKLREIQTRLGIKGFCLEPDLSKPINGKARSVSAQEYACQTWLPIQTSASNIDLFNMNVGAGYLPALDSANAGGDLMCAGVHRGGFLEQVIDGGFNITGQTVSGVYTGDPRPYDMDISVYTSFGNDPAAEYYEATLGRILKNGITKRSYCKTYNILSNDVYTEDSYFSRGTEYELPNNLRLFTFSNLNVFDGPPYWQMICDRQPIATELPVGSQLSWDRRGLYNVPPRLTNTTDQPWISGPAENPYNAFNITVAREVLENWKKTMYKIIKSFAWNKISRNTLVLRAEIHPNKDLTINSMPSDPGSVNNYTGRFAPWAGFVYASENDNYQLSRGSFERWSHPADMNNNISGVYDPTDWVSATDIRVGGYGNLMNLDLAGNYISESNLDSMSFIPLMYKGGMWGFLPKTINEIEDDRDLIKIPIKKLKNSIETGGQAFELTILRAFDVETGINNDLYQHNPTIILSAENPEGGPHGETALANWSYRVNRIDNPSLFCGDGGFVCDNNVETEATVKYVAVFFAPGGSQHNGDPAVDGSPLTTKSPNFINGTQLSELTVPANSALDPFQSECERGLVQEGSGEHHNPWFAVAVNFNDDGEFLGYTTKWCSGNYANIRDWQNTRFFNTRAGFGGGISFAVIADLAQQCFEFSKVNKSLQAGTTETLNKAWTNRVWSGAGARDIPFSGYSKITRNIPQTPYGSVNLSGDNVIEAYTDNNISNLMNFKFNDPATDGMPYACNIIGPSGYIFRNSLNLNSLSPCPFNNDSLYRSGSTANILNDLANSDRTPARTAISYLFAMQFLRAELNNSSTYNITIANDDRSNTFFGKNTYSVCTQLSYPGGLGGLPICVASFKRTDYLFPPSIYSLNPATCQPDTAGNVGSGCSAGDFNNISINGRTGMVKDYNFANGIEIEEVNQSEPLVSVGSLTANAKFFAFADDNRMPIRRISIDWGDEDPVPLVSNGFYKNSKPVCATDSDRMVETCRAVFGTDYVASGLTCQNDNNDYCPIELGAAFHQTGDGAPHSASLSQTPNCLSVAELQSAPYSETYFNEPRFGNQERACSEDPFEFEHPYECTSDMTSAHVQFTNLSPSEKNAVRDAIEIYNESAGTTERINFNDASDVVCKFKPRVQIVDNWGYCNGRCDGGSAGTYCYTQNIDEPGAGSSNDCLWDGPAANTPWTEYKGTILVVPIENF